MLYLDGKRFAVYIENGPGYGFFYPFAGNFVEILEFMNNTNFFVGACISGGENEAYEHGNGLTAAVSVRKQTVVEGFITVLVHALVILVE